MDIDPDASVKPLMAGSVSKTGAAGRLVVARPDYKLADALRLFTRYNLHHLPIVKDADDHTLLGIVSVTDVMRFYATSPGADPRAVALEEIMTRDPTTIKPNTELSEAVRILARASFQSVLVADEGGKLVGIITNRDIVRFLYSAHEDHVYRTVEEIISAATKHEDQPKET